jgi:hypothetical protein
MTDAAELELVTPPPPADLRDRAELLARIAVLRIAGARIYPAERLGRDVGYDFLAVSGYTAFLIVLDQFGSLRGGPADADDAPVWLRSVPADRLRQAVGSPTPVVLFLFDADTEHGRYLRLDTLPEPPADADTVTLRLPIANTITRDSVRRLIDSFAAKS